MSEEKKTVELKEEDLKKVTGGAGETEQKYPNGSIYYKMMGPDFYCYYLILSYNYASLHYVCEKYTVDSLNHNTLKNDSNSNVLESELNDMTRTYSIPYWEG